MATLNEVLEAVVDLIKDTEPDGYNVRYFAGHPFPEDLQAALKTDEFKVNVFPSNVTKRVPLSLGDQPTVLSSTEEQSVIVTPVSRQVKWIEVHIWTNSPASREDVAEAVRIALDETLFLDLPDGTKGYMKYVQEFEDDSNQEFYVYHRTYFYAVEYLTTKRETVYNACHPTILNVDGQVVAIGSEEDTSVLVDEITEE
jgi:hypothetical protein